MAGPGSITMLNLQIIGEVVFRGLCLRDDSEETHHHGQENLAAARSPEVASEIVFATITLRDLWTFFKAGVAVRALVTVVISRLHSSASARPMGIGPVGNFLEDRCGPIVVCLLGAGPRTFRKVYHEIKTRGY